MIGCHRHHPLGYSLIEMLVVIALLGVFLLIASRLYVATVQTQKQAVTLEHRVHQLRDLTDHLEHDVWSADQVEVQPSGIRVTPGEGQPVRWSVRPTQDNGTDAAWRVERVQGGATRGWDLKGKITFDVAPAGGVTLGVDGRRLFLMNQRRRWEVTQR